jgi:putative ABC transport system ATP-binding protein
MTHRPPEAVLEACSLTKEYRRGGASFFAVDGVSLSVYAGDFICISGQSGSGKSTLLGMLAGLLSPTSGSAGFQGKDYARLSDDELSQLRNSRIGYIMQGQSVLPNFTVLQNVMLPHYLAEREGDPAGRAGMLLEQTGIPHLASQYPPELSGGELRRAAIARALLNKPGLLLADEPTGDLDADNTVEIMKIFRRIADEGASVLVVTHDPDACIYGNRRCSMKRGVLSEEQA